MTNIVPINAASRAPAEPVAPVPPASVETEMALLAAALANPEAFAAASGIVEPEHFHHDIHREIFRTAVSVAAAGQTPTMRAVATALGTALSGQELVGGATTAQYLAKLAEEGIATAPVAGEYARTVRDFWALREIMAAALEPAAGKPFVAGQMVERVLARIDEVRAARIDRERHSATIGQAIRDVLAAVDAAERGGDPIHPRITIADLQDLLGGWEPSTLTTLAGRPGMGKSAAACVFADDAASQNWATVYHTTEMSAEQVAARMLSRQLATWNEIIQFSRIMRPRRLSAFERDLVRQVAKDFQGLPLRIEDAGGVTIAQVMATSERRMNEFVRQGLKPGLVVIDHAHQIKAPKQRERLGELTEISQGALALSKNLDCSVLLLAQLNRQVESRPMDERRPTLADLRASGSLEEDSANVLFCYRHAYYVKQSPAYRRGEDAARAEYDSIQHDFEFIVAKNRMGESHTPVLAYADMSCNIIRDRRQS